LPVVVKHDSISKQASESIDIQTSALVSFNDKFLMGKGFMNWKPFKHPTLGDIEIGGEIPFASTTPPAFMLDSLLKNQVPWVEKLALKLAKLKFGKYLVTEKEAGIFHVDVWVENTGVLPFPTAMGKKSQYVAPAIILLEGDNLSLITGKSRITFQNLEGSKYLKFRWIIKANKGSIVKLNLESPNAGYDQLKIELR